MKKSLNDWVIDSISRGHLFSGNANGRSVFGFFFVVSSVLGVGFWDYYHNDYGDSTKYSGA